jgi:hypothetical protein
MSIGVMAEIAYFSSAINVSAIAVGIGETAIPASSKALSSYHEIRAACWGSELKLRLSASDIAPYDSARNACTTQARASISPPIRAGGKACSE